MLLLFSLLAAWPNIQSVLEYYGVNISVAMHTFPLPYHTHAFVIAQGAHVILDAAMEEADSEEEAKKAASSFFT